MVGRHSWLGEFQQASPVALLIVFTIGRMCSFIFCWTGAVLIKFFGLLRN